MNVQTVVVVNDFAYINGGAAKVAILEAIELSGRLPRVLFFSAVGPVCNELLSSDVEVICLNQNELTQQSSRMRAVLQGIWNGTAVKRFSQLLDGLDAGSTIIHFHGWTKALSGALFHSTKRQGFPVYITAHDYFLVCPNGGFYHYRRQHICRLNPMSLACCFCNCDKRSFIQKCWRVVRQIVLQRCLDGNRLVIIYLSHFSSSKLRPFIKVKHTSRYLRNPIEMGESKPVNYKANSHYLFIGRLSEEKGAGLFCQAMTDLKLSGIVIGSGPMENDLKAKYPQVTFAGWLEPDNMKQWIERCRALIFSSKWFEGAPLVVPEILATYGLPCIVPDECAAKEFINVGENGVLFKSGNLEDLKDKLIQFEKMYDDFLDCLEIQKTVENIPNLEEHVSSLIQLYGVEM